MEDAFRIGIGLVGSLVIIGVGIWLGWYVRRKVVVTEAAWRAFVVPRALQFAPHRGAFWWHPGLGASPRVVGVVNGANFAVELAGWKEIDSTRVTAAVQPLGSPPPKTSIVEPDQLNGEAAKAWTKLHQLRPDVGIRLALPGGHPMVWVGWKGIERDPDVLDAAIALAATVARHPPAAATLS
jgi:hypothetical protein